MTVGGRQRLLLVRHAAHSANPRREVAQELDGARDSANGVGGVLRFFEPHGRVGAQPNGRRGFADRGRLKVGALQHHSRRLLRYRAVETADNAGQRDRSAGVGDHQVGGV